MPWLPEKDAPQYWHLTEAPPPADVIAMRESIQWRRQCREVERRAWTDDEWFAAHDDYMEYVAIASGQEQQRDFTCYAAA